MATTRKLRGKLVPTLINYQGKSAEEQAKEILTKVSVYHSQGYKKIGITYSANNDQVEKNILPAYSAFDNNTNANGWRTNIIGGNQAETMMAVETLLATEEYSHLQGVFRILPITTCAHSGGMGPVKQEWLERDVKAIDDFISNDDGIVLGLQNEDANDNNPNAKFAIGGKISKQLSTTKMLDKDGKETDKTQHQFVQEELSKLANRPAPGPNQKKDEQEQSKGPPEVPPGEQSFSGRRIFGGFIGGILGAAAGGIPLLLVLTGVIFIPATLGGSAALIGIGLALFLGGIIGGWLGAKVGSFFHTKSHIQNWLKSNPPGGRSTPAHLQQKLGKGQPGPQPPQLEPQPPAPPGEPPQPPPAPGAGVPPAPPPSPKPR